MDADLKYWLLDIVRQDEWNEEDLAEWANEFLALYYHEVPENDEEYQRDRKRIRLLKPSVVPYKHDNTLPELPEEPDGSIHGVGFIYDEDTDDRVLVAIDNIRDRKDLVAVSEHEGSVKVYSRRPTGITGMHACLDEWGVTEYVPYRGRWVEVNQQFMADCVSQVLGFQTQAV